MKLYSAISRRDALRVLGGATIAFSCSGELDERDEPNGPDAGAPDHPPGVLDFSALLNLPSGQIAMDADTIFAADTYPSDARDVEGSGAIVGIPRRGGPARRIASGQTGPYYLNLDGDSLYWANLGTATPQTSTIQTVSRSGGQIMTIAHTSGQIEALSSANGAVAFIVNESLTREGSAGVYSAALGRRPVRVPGNQVATTALFIVRDIVYWVSVGERANAYQIMKSTIDGRGSQLVIEVPNMTIFVLNERAVYVNSAPAEVRFFDGRLVTMTQRGPALAVSGSRIALGSFNESPGISFFDFDTGKAEPLFALKHKPIAIAFDDKGVAWLEETKMFEHSGPPALFYYPFAS